MNLLTIFGTSAADQAQTGVNAIGGNNNANAVNIYDALNKILGTLFVAMGIVAVIYVIYGGFLMSSSGGDPGKVTKGKNAIIWGIVGLIISLLAFAIVNFVLNIFK